MAPDASALATCIERFVQTVEDCLARDRENRQAYDSLISTVKLGPWGLQHAFTEGGHWKYYDLLPDRWEGRDGTEYTKSDIDALMQACSTASSRRSAERKQAEGAGRELAAILTKNGHSAEGTLTLVHFLGDDQDSESGTTKLRDHWSEAKPWLQGLALQTSHGTATHDEPMTEPLTQAELAAYFEIGRNRVSAILDRYPHEEIAGKFRLPVRVMPPRYTQKSPQPAQESPQPMH
jgi:hypothetical protein